MTAESFQKIEKNEQSPILETAEKELAEMNQEMEDFLGELDIAEKKITEPELRDQIKELKNEAKWTADWWAGNILAFTNIVVGDGINFPVVEKIKEANKKETPEEMRDRAKKELAENGITSEQMKTYQPINDTIRRGVSPFSYNLKEHIHDLLLFTLISGKRGPNEWSDIGIKHREDAWRIYLGIPQKDETFEISDYSPNKELGLERFSSDEYCYKIKDFWSLFSGQRDVPILIQIMEQKEAGGKVYTAHDVINGIMGNYSLHLGKDEKGSYLAYSDVWDLAVFPENEKGFFGKPFHIYDRLYYDPETFEPIYEFDTK